MRRTKVLVISKDIYSTVGGGEAVYKRIIEGNPEIDFFYFRDSEPTGAVRPANATALRLEETRQIHVKDPLFPKFKIDNLCVASAYARSVSGQTFDIVEVPDYWVFGSFLRACFKYHGVEVGALVLAMHGNISMSIQLGWGAPEGYGFEERQLEYEQFQDADARYAISPKYIREWHSRSNLEIHYLDPMGILGTPRPLALVDDSSKPNLYCIGRMERRKGNDLFVEIVRWLDPKLYHSAYHVGGHDSSSFGYGSQQSLTEIAGAREVNIEFLGSKDKDGLRRIFAGRSLVVLPVRYDSLNLVAAEALFSGCPVVVSNGAGICDYLDAHFPGLPYVKLDLQNFYGVVNQIEAVLRRYDNYRKELVDYLGRRSHVPSSLDMRPVYEAALSAARARAGTPRARNLPEFWETSLSPQIKAKALARRLLPADARLLLRRLSRQPKQALIGLLARLRWLAGAKAMWIAMDSRLLAKRFRAVHAYGEGTLDQLASKLRAACSISDNPIFRCNLWNEIARLERIRGNRLVAVTYELRLLRLLGKDMLGRLPRILETLTAEGFEHEAEACRALYAEPAKSDERVYQYLKAAFARNQECPARPYEFVDDRRYGRPQVAVIVSLFNAAPKLRLFLSALALQTLVRKDAVEVIFVDSGSPTNEYEIVKQFLSHTPLSLVYARSKLRETIQAAWNRGIHLARAEYLVFLGVDETLYPEALEVLATELDVKPEVDWVMADSLVTAVDTHGVLKNDIMTYDRKGGTRDSAYLETCYLSWVGGMYRKSVHTRFGFYDETFRAAGDTEFKNRVLPFISVSFVPRTLGLFLNYPDDRTTASPRAEIEDTRAWYIHRTPGGIRYGFEQRSPEDVRRLLCMALGYRKSYSTRISSDVEYAKYLADYYLKEKPSRDVDAVRGDLTSLLENLRSLEWAHSPTIPRSAGLSLARMLVRAKRLQRRHKKLFRGEANPHYGIFNDNRYEQHSWLWSAS